MRTKNIRMAALGILSLALFSNAAADELVFTPGNMEGWRSETIEALPFTNTYSSLDAMRMWVYSGSAGELEKISVAISTTQMSHLYGTIFGVFINAEDFALNAAEPVYTGCVMQLAVRVNYNANVNLHSRDITIGTTPGMDVHHNGDFTDTYIQSSDPADYFPAEVRFEALFSGGSATYNVFFDDLLYYSYTYAGSEKIIYPAVFLLGENNGDGTINTIGSISRIVLHTLPEIPEPSEAAAVFAMAALAIVSYSRRKQSL